MVYRKQISSENPSKCKVKENIYTISFVTQLKPGILTIKTGLFFLYNDLFFFARLEFWVFK